MEYITLPADELAALIPLQTANEVEIGEDAPTAADCDVEMYRAPRFSVPLGSLLAHDGRSEG